jgi:hypothetical protein
MKRWLIPLLALLSSLIFAPPVFAQTGAIPNQSAAISVATGTTAQLIAAPGGGQSIRVTHFDLFAAGTGNASLEYGTGTNCATGATALTGVYTMTAGTNTSVGDGSAVVLNVPPGQAVCILTTASVLIAGSISWEQF